MFHFNILLIHPDSTIDSIDREIEGLSEVNGGLIDPFQVEVYQGTRLFEKLAREGRLLGGPLLFHFWPEEPAARRFSEIFYRLKRDAFGFIHLTAFAYEVLGAFAVARKLGLVARQSTRLGLRATELIEKHNALWVDLLHQTSALSRASAGSAQVDRFIEQTQIRSALQTLSFNEFKQTLERTATQPLTSDIFYPRTAAAVAVAVALLGTNACASSARPDTIDAEIAQKDSGRDADRTTDSDSRADARVYVDADSCTRTVADHEAQVASENVTGVCYKNDFSCDLTPARDSRNGHWYTTRLILDENGYVTDIQSDGSDRDLFTPELKSCYLAALKGQRFPCLAEQNRYWINCGVLLA